MGLWSFYFLAKTGLYFSHLIGFHAWPNFAFALFTLIPARRRGVWIVKQLLALPAAIALLYYDSYLPPFSRLLAQVDQLAQFRAPYLLELAGRFVDLRLLMLLATALLVHQALARKLRMSTFALIALLAAAVAPLLQHPMGAAIAAGNAPVPNAAGHTDDAPIAAQLTAQVDEFFRKESGRRVTFPGPIERRQPFDVVYLHVCSLAQDDLDYVDARQHSLFRRFNLVLQNFNTAASYSGPAALRLLRSGCGQQRHDALYQRDPPECHLFADLQQAGFETQWVMNHDGRFDDFAGTVRAQLGRKVARQTFPAPVTMHGFDGSPIQQDYALLEKWWQQRLASPAPQVALYYNSISLHDGNRIDGGTHRGNKESYTARLNQVLDDFGRFFDLVQASGRRMVVVMVPEHGANVRGDQMQVSGLREIPSPAIALAPVGVQLIGWPAGAALPAQAKIEQPVSHLAVTHIVAQLLLNSPFETPPPDWNVYVRDLPQTDFVAENEGQLVLRHDERYYLRNPDGSWVHYAD